MYDAIEARYPQLKLIATTGGYQGGAASSTSSGTTPDVVDDHYQEVSGLTTSSRFGFPPYSVTVLRVTGGIS
jgi:hypothetical protein